MYMDAYSAHQQSYGHPLIVIMSKKAEERGKTRWGKSALKIGHERKTKNAIDAAPIVYVDVCLNLLLGK